MSFSKRPSWQMRTVSCFKEYKKTTYKTPIIHYMAGNHHPNPANFQNPSWTHPRSFHRPTFHGYLLVQRSKAKGNVLPDRGGEKPWILWNHLTQWIFRKKTPLGHTVHDKIPFNTQVLNRDI